MKTIEVVAAVIRKGDHVLAAQRGYGDYKGRWEFPGGKIKPGETPEQALKREIMEELKIDISVEDFISAVEYDYPDFHLSMRCYWCRILEGALVLTEHEDSKWLLKGELYSVTWLPADQILVPRIAERLNQE